MPPVAREPPANMVIQLWIARNDSVPRSRSTRGAIQYFSHETSITRSLQLNRNLRWRIFY